MSFSSRRRNYLLTPHRRDGLIEWMKSMLQHSFVLDSLETTAFDTFQHFEILIDEHRSKQDKPTQPSRLQQIVPTVGIFHTHLPLRAAFEVYNEKTRVTKRKHIQISFNEIRHILNLAQIMALRPNVDAKEEASGAAAAAFLRENSEVASSNDLEAASDEEETSSFNGPKLISFDGDQTLYSDGANFDSNPRLAFYLYQLLKHGVVVAVVTAAGYEYQVKKYEHRLSGLLRYFESKGLTEEEMARFYLFGGECNYLLRLGKDYRLHAVKEQGPGGWCTSTRFLKEAPANWSEDDVSNLLDVAQDTFEVALEELNLRARVIRKKRAVGLVPKPGEIIPRESLDEAILRSHERAQKMNDGSGARLPYCAFNGGSDAWVDVGNKRVGVQVLQAFLGVAPNETLHIGDQFLNTGNDYAARAVSPCVWITNPQETTYILKSILRLAAVSYVLEEGAGHDQDDTLVGDGGSGMHAPKFTKDDRSSSGINFSEVERRSSLLAKTMDVYTGEMISASK